MESEFTNSLRSKKEFKRRNCWRGVSCKVYWGTISVWLQNIPLLFERQNCGCLIHFYILGRNISLWFWYQYCWRTLKSLQRQGRRLFCIQFDEKWWVFCSVYFKQMVLFEIVQCNLSGVLVLAANIYLYGEINLFL